MDNAKPSLGWEHSGRRSDSHSRYLHLPRMCREHHAIGEAVAPYTVWIVFHSPSKRRVRGLTKLNRQITGYLWWLPHC